MKSVFLFLLFLSNVLYAQSPIGASGILFSQAITPATPPSNHDQFYFDSTTGNPSWIDPSGRINFSLAASQLGLTYTTTSNYQAANINGASYITASDSVLPTGNVPFSISLWMKTSSSNGNMTLIHWGQYGPESGIENNIYINNVDGPGDIYWEGYDADYDAPSDVNNGNWHFLVFTYDGAGNNVIYQDGSSIASFVQTRNITANQTDGTFVVGATNSSFTGGGAGQSPYTGLIEELQIYNIALSPSTVTALYNSGSGIYGTGSESGLVAGYHYNGNANAYAGGQNGTWVGTEQYTTGVIPNSSPVTDTYYFTYSPTNGLQFNGAPIGASILPGGSVIQGTYITDVYVNGSASLAANTIVQGDLIVTGTLSNPNGYSLNVTNDCNVGGFSFTPTSLSTTQGNVTIGGSFTVQSFTPSSFQPNPGQNPTLFVGGDMFFATASGQEFNGAGQPGANGLTVTVNGSVSGYGNSGYIGGAGSLITDGGPDTASLSGGNGGTITIGGTLNNISISSQGGISTNAGQNAGSGGTVYVGQDSFTQGFVVDGGASSGSGGNGGNGGNIYVDGFSFVGAGGLFTANGGACGGSTATSGAGSGGNINPGTGGTFAQLSAVGGDITGTVTSNLNAGSGGTFTSQLSVAPVIGPINVSGGSVDSGTNASSPFTVNCGPGGTIKILGSYISSEPFNSFDFSLYANGGSFQSTDPNLTGSGGTGGIVQLVSGSLTNIYANGGGSSSAIAAAPPGSITISKSIQAAGVLSLLDGTTGTTASGAASLILNGDCTINSIAVQNRAGVLIQPGGSVPVVLKVGSMTGLSQLTNAGNTQTTASLSGSLANSIFTYDIVGNTWSQNSGSTPGLVGFPAGGSDTAIQINEAGILGGNTSYIATSSDYKRLLLAGATDDTVSALQANGMITAVGAIQVTNVGNEGGFYAQGASDYVGLSINNTSTNGKEWLIASASNGPSDTATGGIIFYDYNTGLETVGINDGGLAVGNGIAEPVFVTGAAITVDGSSNASILWQNDGAGNIGTPTGNRVGSVYAHNRGVFGTGLGATLSNELPSSSWDGSLWVGNNTDVTIELQGNHLYFWKPDAREFGLSAYDTSSPYSSPANYDTRMYYEDAWDSNATGIPTIAFGGLATGYGGSITWLADGQAVAPTGGGTDYGFGTVGYLDPVLNNSGRPQSINAGQYLSAGLGITQPLGQTLPGTWASDGSNVVTASSGQVVTNLLQVGDVIASATAEITNYVVTSVSSGSFTCDNGIPPASFSDVVRNAATSFNRMATSGGLSAAQLLAIDPKGNLLFTTDGSGDIGSPDGGVTNMRPNNEYVANSITIGTSAGFHSPVSGTLIASPWANTAALVGNFGNSGSNHAGSGLFFWKASSRGFGWYNPNIGPGGGLTDGDTKTYYFDAWDGDYNQTPQISFGGNSENHGGEIRWMSDGQAFSTVAGYNTNYGFVGYIDPELDNSGRPQSINAGQYLSAGLGITQPMGQSLPSLSLSSNGSATISVNSSNYNNGTLIGLLQVGDLVSSGSLFTNLTVTSVSANSFTVSGSVPTNGDFNITTRNAATSFNRMATSGGFSAAQLAELDPSGNLLWASDGGADIGSPDGGVTQLRPRNAYLSGDLHSVNIRATNNIYVGNGMEWTNTNLDINQGFNFGIGSSDEESFGFRPAQSLWIFSNGSSSYDWLYLSTSPSSPYLLRLVGNSSSTTNSLDWYNDASGSVGTAGHGPNAIFNDAPQTTLHGSAGTAVCSQPEQGSAKKEILCYLNGYTDTGSVDYTFPTAFTQAAPQVLYAPAGVTVSESTSQLAFVCTLATGYVVLEGF
jgi:hypothetical protein